MLFYLGGECNGFKGGDKFGIGETTFYRHVVEAAEAVVMELQEEVIKLPVGDDLEACLRATDEHDPPLPGCALFMDGTHIEFTPPRAIFLDYRNYKGRCTIQAQVVCDYECKVRDLVVGHSGKNHDARVSLERGLFLMQVVSK